MSDIQWHLETRKLKDLKKHPKNPRTLTKEQYRHLKKSIDKFGLIDKIIVNTDNQIIGGHQRFEILKKDKVAQTECWIPSRTLDEKEVEELLIRANKNTGSWNDDILANEFEIPDLLEYGFNAEELFDSKTVNADDEKETTTKDKSHECPNCGHIFS